MIRSLIDRGHGRLRVSISETDHHDLHQRTELGIALVHSDRHEAGRILERMHQLIAEQSEAQLLNWDAEVIEDFDE